MHTTARERAAFDYLIAGIPGADDLDAVLLDTDRFAARLSTGEQALLALALDLYQGRPTYRNVTGRPWTIRRILDALDLDNRRRALTALAIYLEAD